MKRLPAVLGLILILFAWGCRKEEPPVDDTYQYQPGNPSHNVGNRYCGQYIGTTTIIRFDTMSMDSSVVQYNDTCFFSPVGMDLATVQLGGIGFNTFSGIDTASHIFTWDSFNNMSGYYTGIGTPNPIVDLTIDGMDSADYHISWIFHGQR
jgi:hypothetical protein